jgi:predicted membrane protein
VAVGASFLLTNLNILPFSVGIAEWWPMFIVVGGIVILLSDVKNYLWALLVIALGIIFQLKQLGVVSVNPWQLFWPAVIIVIGISIMMSRATPKQRIASHEREDITAVLSGSETRVQSKDYRGSRVIAVCGGAMIDLREVTIKKEATLDLFAFWGGIEIYCPKEVIVRNSTSVILGGVENATTDTSIEDDAPILRIIGDVVMSGVEIKR